MPVQDLLFCSFVNSRTDSRGLRIVTFTLTFDLQTDRSCSQT